MFNKVKRRESEREQILSEYGKNGWELVSVDNTISCNSVFNLAAVYSNKVTYYFKREL